MQQREGLPENRVVPLYFYLTPGPLSESSERRSIERATGFSNNNLQSCVPIGPNSEWSHPSLLIPEDRTVFRYPIPGPSPYQQGRVTYVEDQYKARAFSHIAT